MAKLTGLAGLVSELRAERTSLVDRLRHVDAALSVLGKLRGARSYTKPGRTLSASARKRDQLGTESAMGKGESAETHAHNFSSRQKEDRSGCTCTLGEGEGAAKEGWLECCANTHQ